MLIILPDHLCVSGITTWAIHAIKGLRSRSIPAGLIVHTEPGGSVPEFLEPFVVARVHSATQIHRLRGCLDELVPVYQQAIEKMYAQTNQPVLVSPNLHGDCYGAIATIAQSNPHLIRVASWIHSDNEYDIAVAKRFEPMIHAIVPVSSELDTIAKRTMPDRSDDVVHIPYCVEVDPACPARTQTRNRPLRLVYTGRLEEHQKRISSLPHLARQLRDRGLDFEFRVVGDGPEMDALLEATASIDQIRFIGSVPPGEVPDHLRWADLWILPSRYEGQSVAMLEALAHGCVPIVTQVRSGASDAVITGTTGISVDSDWNTPIEEVARSLCEAIISIASPNTKPDTEYDITKMADNAHQLALEHHSVPRHIDRLESLIERVQDLPDRQWPGDLRASYSAPQEGLDGSTPPDAAKRMIELLDSLEGRKVLIYCSGQHTKDVSSAIRNSKAQIIGIVDDDPSKAGTGLIGYPIYPSSMIPQLQATELVISSWIYEDTIWTKRTELEALGVTLHRLYPTSDSPSAESIADSII